MAESKTSNPRIEQLKRRLEMTPESRVFLQLAEEYRRAGGVEEAISVLETGLEKHPSYLSAKVALGRARIEIGDGDAAHDILQEVIAADSTHLVASKLLVNAYLLQGNPIQARRQLDLYRLMNSVDPEVDELAEKIESLQLAEAEPSAVPASTGEDGTDEGDEASDVVFTEWPSSDPFDLDPAMGVGAEEISVKGPGVLSSEEPFADADDDEPFADLLSAPLPSGRPAFDLGTEGIFTDGEPVAKATTEELAESLDAGHPAGAAQRETSIYDLEPSPLDLSNDETAGNEADEPPAEAAPAEEGMAEESSASAAARAEEVETIASEATVSGAADDTSTKAQATSTLGALYLRQGHFDEAERIFRDVLEHRPDEPTALRGLAELEALHKGRVTARRLLGDRFEGHELSERERKVLMLEEYSRHLGEGRHSGEGQDHVS